MTLSIVDTALAEPPRLPAPRESAWNPALRDAVIPAAGLDATLARLSAPGALAVTTGQQPGLFLGPAYTVAKALSARALAAILEARWRRPVVPIYWVPGDDHDFDEVATAAWLGAEGQLVQVTLPPRPPDAPQLPMYRQPLGPGVIGALEDFERSFPDADTREPALAWLSRHYRPEMSVAGAFGSALAELLAPYGVLCLDSTHPAVKAAAAPHLLRALTESEPLEGELLSLSRSLASEGRDPGVPVGDAATLVFLETELGRDRLVRAGKGFSTRRGKQSFSLADLTVIARQEPTRFSGNVLLRPVLESAVLPTVAYVAGPGELRYLALTPPVYQRLGVSRQLPVARWSGLLLEPRVTRVLQKFAASLEELLADGGALETRLARAALPEGSDAAFAALRGAIEAGYAPVIAAATSVDPTLTRPATAARGQAVQALLKLEAKLLQHARKRESIELAQVDRARRSVRPLGKPQERVLTLAGFLARYGMGLLDDLAAHIDAWYRRALEAATPTA